MTRARQILVLAVLAAGAFLLLVGYGDIASSHEARVAATARTMAEAGWPWNARAVDVPRVAYREIEGIVRLAAKEDAEPMHVNPWGVPVLTGEIRLQKPPLPYWCDAVLFRLMGSTALAARLAPALLGAVATFLVFDLARLMLGRRAAWYAGLIWVSSYFIPEEYRKTMADPYLAFFVLACAWSWIRAARARRGGFIILFYVFAGLGLLAKGPPLFVHLVIVLGAYHWCSRRRLPGGWGAHLLGLGAALLIAAPWPVYVLRHVGMKDVLAMWRYESVGELGQNTENARPWWFYAPQIFLLILPWFVLSGLGVARLFVGRAGGGHVRSRRPLFALVWFAGTVLFFSFVNLKKNAYLLPAMPALAMLTAQGAALLVGWSRRRRQDPGPRVLAAIQGVCGVGLAVWLAWLLLGSVYRRPLGMGIALAGAGLVAGLWPLWLALRHSRRDWAGGWLAAQAVGYVVLISLLLNFYNGVKDNRESARPFIARITPLLRAPGCTLYRKGMSPDAAFYLPPGLLPFDPDGGCVHVLVEGSIKHPKKHDAGSFASVETHGRVTEATKVAEDRVSGWSLYGLTVRPRETVPGVRGAASTP